MFRVHAVTVYAPAHIEVVFDAVVIASDADFIHVLDVAMAVLACEAARNVRFVRKAHVVRQIVHFSPANRSSLLETLAEKLYIRTVGCNYRVAFHAGGHVWHSCMRGNFHAGMAELTVDL